MWARLRPTASAMRSSKRRPRYSSACGRMTPAGCAGLSYKRRTRGTTPNPLVWIANAAAKAMNRYAVELGMTPASRVGLEGDDQRPRRFDGLLAG